MMSAKRSLPTLWIVSLLLLMVFPKGGFCDDEMHVMIELSDPPAARVFAQEAFRTGAGREQRARAVELTRSHLGGVREAQEQLLATMQAPDVGARALFRTQRVYNGIAVAVDASKLSRIRNLPGVKAIHPLAPKRLNVGSSVPSTGAPRLWAQSGLNIRGDNISIGIIDTGIDYLHKDFGGAGKGYEGVDPTVVEPGKGYPSDKVAGGYDFVGDAYDPLSKNPELRKPVADPNPMDCNGHGTHVAGIAAGLGVTADGKTYSGPYDASVDYSGLLIGPGVAPGATIYALKVFGRAGITFVISEAIEWAVDPDGDGDFSDHLDVINLSLGSEYGSGDDPDSVACDNAALAGVIVVASAGNSWNGHYIVGAPSSASRCISVASSLNPSAYHYRAAGHEERIPLLKTGYQSSLSDFSSRGPRCGDSMLKPDITAPGEQIASAAYLKGKNAVYMSGTSMAAPHVAGGMALLRQIHPDWSVEELKALVMNTASAGLVVERAGKIMRYSPQRVGGGGLNLKKAAVSSVIVYDAQNPELVSLSFGAPEVTRSTTLKKTLRVENKGSAPVAFGISFDETSSIPGVTLAFPEAVTVEAGSVADLEVALIMSASKMKHSHDPLLSISDGPRHWMSEVSGYLTFKPAGKGAHTLRAPVYAAPRRVSGMGAELPDGFLDKSGTLKLELTGRGLSTGTDLPLDELSLVSGFELQGVLPKPTGSDMTASREKAMIKAVGVSVTPKESPAGSLISFGIGAHGRWSSPGEVQFRVLVDTDADGAAERVVANINLSDDYFLTEICKMSGDWYCAYRNLNRISPRRMDTVPFNSSVMVLTASAAELGLKEGRMSFRYRVKSFDSLGRVSSSPVYRYDAARPGLVFGGKAVMASTYADLGGRSLPLLFNRNRFKENGSLGVLMLHHHNAASGQIEVGPGQLTGEPMNW